MTTNPPQRLSESRLVGNHLRDQYVMLTIVAGYAVLQCGAGLFRVLPCPAIPFTVADLSAVSKLSSYLASVLLTAALDTARFAVLGGLAAMVPHVPGRRFLFLRVLLFGALVSLLFAALIRICETRGWPEMVQLITPLLGCISGAWVIAVWRMGFWGRLSLIPQAALLVAALGTLFLGSFEIRPLPFDTEQITSAQKRRIVNIIRYSGIMGGQGDRVKSLGLKQRDVNLLMSWGLQVVGSKQSPSKAVVQFDEGAFQAQASLHMPDQSQRFLNIDTSCRIAAEFGVLDLHLKRLNIGRLRVPDFMLPLVSALVESTVRYEPELESLIANVERLDVRPHHVQVTVTQSADLDNMRPPFDVLDPRVQEAALAQLHHLTNQLDQLNDNSDGFANFVQAAFLYASVRSGVGNAKVENEGAICALGVLLGHVEVGRLLLGSRIDELTYRAAAVQNGRVPVRGRRDWTRHFFVSAVLAVVTNESISDAAGLLKEELDAGRGGSGFSFADLLADRAGTRFALAITRDEEAARQLQLKLSQKTLVNELFPPADDLPEGLDDDRLQEEYDGVDGARYRELITEIERRLDDCHVLQAP